MRNLKRALSLALASVMLLGMMVTGAGAVESIGFTDADEIVNQEAAAVTSGLGIFDGYTDGSFGPERAVTRAEMAVIICKILNGADVDHSNFTGTSKFTDVPAWAEGYVNYCASMEIVKGVGDGKFDPSSTVTTVQAATMLLKSLGYYTEEDQLKDDWKTVVTGRASSLKLYGALTLGVDEPLTRDNVALLVFNTIQAQRVAYDDNRNLYVNNRNRDEVVTNGTKDWRNTLAENTFDMWIVDGVVTANSLTDDSLSETVNNAPRTRVEFYDARTIEGYVEDYPAQTYQGNPVNNGYPFEYTTGLDMIGHAARVYYKIERNAPYVYAITDRATKWEYISYNENSTLRANAANEAGFRRNTINEIATDDYKVNYDWNNTVGVLKADTNSANDVVLNGPSVNKTLLLISNSSDHKVDVVIVLDQYLDTVRRVIEATETTPVEYKLTTHDGTDQNVPHGTFAVNDYVVVTDIGNQGKMLNIAAPEKVTASISKITGVSDGNGTVKSITADGTEYVGSPVAHHETAKQKLDANTRSLDNTTNFENIQTIGEATLLLDFQGKCIGLAEPEAATNYAYAAQFGVGHKNGSLNTEYGLTVKLHFIDGTSGVYNVNTSSGTNSTNTFKGLKMSIHGDEHDARDIADMLNKGLVGTVSSNTAVYDPRDTYTSAFGVNANGSLVGITNETETGLGIYKVSLRSDNSVVLTKLWNEPNQADVSENSDLLYKQDNAAKQTGKSVRLVPGHSTLVKGNGSNAMQVGYPGAPVADRTMYQTDKTAYFYVDGDFGAKTYDGANITVGVKTGVANTIGFTVGGDKDNNQRDESIEQLFVTRVVDPKIGDRDTVSAMMVFGYDMGANDSLYFYKEGNYHIYGRNTNAENRAGGELVYVVYDMYDTNGEMKQATYNNGGSYFDIEVARDMVSNNPTGYYTMGGDDIEPKFVVTKNGLGGAVNNGVVTDGSTQSDREFNVIKTDAAKYGGVADSLEKAKNVYILNATVQHDEFVQNLYTAVDGVGGIVGLLDDNVTVIDTTGNRIDSTRAIADKCIAGDTVRVSYCYKTEDYKVKVVFVTGFLPKEQDTQGGQKDTTIVNGNVTLVAPAYASPVYAYHNVYTGQLNFSFNAPAGYSGNVDYKYSVWVDGTEVMHEVAATGADRAPTAAGILSVRTAGVYAAPTSKIRIVVTDVVPAAYTVKSANDDRVAVTPSSLTTGATGGQLTVTVKGMTQPKANVTYVVKNVALTDGTTITKLPGNTYTSTPTEFTNAGSGTSTPITTTQRFVAVGPVTVDVLNETNTEYGVTVNFTGDANNTDWSLTAESDPTNKIANKLSTTTASPLTYVVSSEAAFTGGVNINAPASVTGFTATITVSGLDGDVGLITLADGASDNQSRGDIKLAPFDGTAYKATGPVVITVNVTVAAENYSAKLYGTDIPSGGKVKLGATEITATSTNVAGAGGKLAGNVVIDNITTAKPGTYTLEVLKGGTLTGGTVSKHADRNAGVTFNDVEITGVKAGEDVLIGVTFVEDTEVTLTIATGQNTASAVGGSADNYHVSKVELGSATLSSPMKACVGETVKVTVTLGSTTSPATGVTALTDEGTITVSLGANKQTIKCGEQTLTDGAGTVAVDLVVPETGTEISLSYTAPTT